MSRPDNSYTGPLLIFKNSFMTIVCSSYSIRFKGKEDPYVLLELFFSFEVFSDPEFLLIYTDLTTSLGTLLLRPVL